MPGFNATLVDHNPDDMYIVAGRGRRLDVVASEPYGVWHAVQSDGSHDDVAAGLYNSFTETCEWCEEDETFDAGGTDTYHVRHGRWVHDRDCNA